jgi:hypothetical protein
MQPGLYHILFISAALFFIGVYGFFTRRKPYHDADEYRAYIEQCEPEFHCIQ